MNEASPGSSLLRKPSTIRRGIERYRPGELNLDLGPASISQLFLYDRDLFPLSHVYISKREKQAKHRKKDRPESVDYDLPPLRQLSIKRGQSK